MKKIILFYYNSFQDFKKSSHFFKILTTLFFICLMYILFFPKVKSSNESILSNVIFYIFMVSVFLTQTAFLIWLDNNADKITFDGAKGDSESNKLYVKLLARGAMILCIFLLIVNKTI